MTTIYATLVGYHGRRNFGDDIFLRVAIKWLERHCKTNTIFVAGKREGVPTVIDGVNLVAFEKNRYLITRFLWLDIFRHALRSRVLLFSAGSIFTIQPFFLAWVLLKVLRMLGGKNFHIVSLGVSVGPLRNTISRYWCPKIFELMDFSVLRDRASTELLEASELPIHYALSYDLALQWSPAWERKTVSLQTQRKVIGICLHPGAWREKTKSNIDTSVEIIVSTLKKIKQLHPLLECEVFAACDDEIDGDVNVAKKMTHHLESTDIGCRTTIYDGATPEKFASCIQHCSAIITTRMHVGIIAMMGAVPVLQLAYAPKVGAFFDHCGLDTEYLANPDSLTEKQITAFLNESLTGALNNLAEERRTTLAALRDKVVNSMSDLASHLSH